MPEPKIQLKPVTFVDTKKKALLDLDEAASDPSLPVAVDTEFMSNAKLDTDIVIWSYSRGRGERKVVLGEFAKSVYADWLCDRKYKKVFAQYKADAPVFRKLGLDLDRSFHADIVHMDFFVDENNRKHGLKDQVYRLFRRRRLDYRKLFCYVPEGKKKEVVLNPLQLMGFAPLPDGAPPGRAGRSWRELFESYSGDDGEDTILCYQDRRRRLQDIGYWPTYLRVDRKFTLALMRCEERGIEIDQEGMAEILVQAKMDSLRAGHVFMSMLGVEGLNLNAKPKLRQLLVDELGWPEYEDMRTEKSGEQQMSKPALKRWLKEGYAPAHYLMERNSKLKLCSDIKSIRAGVSRDGRLRSDYNQIGAISGRVSSRKWKEERLVTTTSKRGVVKQVVKRVQLGANLQNVVGQGEKDPYGLRARFVAPEGCYLVVADYSGFELCMAIHWSSKFTSDSKMLAVMQKYKNPSAIHAYTAIEMFGLPLTMESWGDVKKKFPDKYKLSKNCNFNLLFMGSPQMLARLRDQDARIDSVMEENQALYDGWYKLYPEIKTYQQKMIEHGYEHGWVPTISGRRCNVAVGLSSIDKWERLHWERKCTNNPCQGSAADIVKLAMVLIEDDAVLRELGYRMLMQIHDEIVGEVPIENAEAAKVRVEELMKRPYASELAFGAMTVETKYAANWQEAK